MEVQVKRRPYDDTQSITPKRFRVVGVRDEDGDNGYGCTSQTCHTRSSVWLK